MNARTLGRIAAAAALCLTIGSVEAQGWNYPSMMTPTIVSRQYGLLLANGGDAGTAILGQWREGLNSETEFQAEIGFADPDGLDARFILGAALARRLTRATQEMPLDMVLTGGIYPSFGDPATLIRIPVQLSMGHRFDIENSQVAITPFLNPRLSFDMCTGGDDDCGEDETDLSINFDLGAAFELSRNLSLVAAILFPGGDSFDDNGFGFGIYWRPGGIR
jgi:hypothetical protein